MGMGPVDLNGDLMLSLAGWVITVASPFVLLLALVEFVRSICRPPVSRGVQIAGRLTERN